jgi:hypothetical protein
VGTQTKSSGIGQRFGVSVVGAGAFYGLIQLLQTQLGAFHLQPWVQRLLTLTVGALGLLLSQFRAVRAANLEDQQRLAALDAGMASFTPRHIGELSALDLGVRRSGDDPGPYVERDVDLAVAQAFEKVGAVVVVGPERCGKTSTALHCLTRDDNVVLLVPEDAQGLGAMLSPLNRAALREWALARGEVPVLWLDNLERFLEGLDLDALDRFQRPGLMTRGPNRRTLWVRRLGIRRKTGGPEAAVLDRPHVRLMATLGEDQLDELLTGADERSRTGRRLLARVQGIPLGDPLSAAEQARFSTVHKDAALGASVSAMFPDLAARGWTPGMPWTRKEPDRAPFKAPLVTGALVLITLALAVATVAVAHNQGWTVPPPIPSQISAIEAALEPCQHGVSSLQTGLGPGARLVMMVDSAACPAPDQLRYYEVRHGRLVLRFVETPKDQTKAWRMFCIGPAQDPCRLPVGASVLIPAAVQEPTHSQLLPMVIYPTAGRTRLRAAFLSSPPTGGDPDAAVERQLKVVPLSQGAPADANPNVPRVSCRAPGRLCGYPAEGLAAVPAAVDRHPALLIAGYLASGSASAPRVLFARAWEISVPRRGDLIIGTRTCLPFDHGLISADVPVTPGETPGAALRQWFARSSTRVVC